MDGWIERVSEWASENLLRDIGVGPQDMLVCDPHVAGGDPASSCGLLAGLVLTQTNGTDMRHRFSLVVRPHEVVRNRLVPPLPLHNPLPRVIMPPILECIPLPALRPPPLHIDVRVIRKLQFQRVGRQESASLGVPR